MSFSPNPSGLGSDPVKAPLRLSSAEINALARRDFLFFLECVFPILHAGQEFVFAEYIDMMATLLMRAEQGTKRRLIFNLPPRHMKSMIVSVFYVAWRLGRNPSAKFICISYGDDLAHELSGLTRKLMQSPVYRRIFPNTVLDKKAVDHIKTTAGGARYATSIGSDITGFGADVIIIDDPMQPEQAASELSKQRIWSYVQSSVLTRFNNPKKGELILVMHRLAPDDLSATLEATGAYFTLKLPMIAERKEHFTDNSTGRTIMRRQPGDLLNPDRLGVAEVTELKATMAPHVWSGQYQQRPTAGGSGMLSIDKFPRFDLTKPPTFDTLIHSWDLGATTSGNASVCTRWGVRTEPGGRDVLYLLGVIRIKVEVPEVRAAIKAQDRLDKPGLIIIDERGVGLGVYQDLRRDGYRHLANSTATSDTMDIGVPSPSKPNASKVERFGRASLLIADGYVVIPHAAPWLESFLYEVGSFPNIADDDQVDSMTQLVVHMKDAIQRARQGLRPHELD